MDELLEKYPGALFGRPCESIFELHNVIDELVRNPLHIISSYIGTNELGTVLYQYNLNKINRPTIRLIFNDLFELVYDVREWTVNLIIHFDDITVGLGDLDEL